MSGSLLRLLMLMLAGALCGAAFAVFEDGGAALYLAAAVAAALVIVAFVMFQRPKDDEKRAALDIMLGDMDDPGQRRIMLRSGLWMVLHLGGLAALATERPVEGALAIAAFFAFAIGGFLMGLETWRFATYDEFLKSFYLRAFALTGLFFAFFVIMAEAAAEWLGLPETGLFTHYLGFSVILLLCCMFGKARGREAGRA